MLWTPKMIDWLKARLGGRGWGLLYRLVQEKSSGDISFVKQNCGTWSRLEQHKPLFAEPKGKVDFIEVWYSLLLLFLFHYCVTSAKLWILPVEVLTVIHYCKTLVLWILCYWVSRSSNKFQDVKHPFVISHLADHGAVLWKDQRS